MRIRGLANVPAGPTRPTARIKPKIRAGCPPLGMGQFPVGASPTRQPLELEATGVDKLAAARESAAFFVFGGAPGATSLHLLPETCRGDFNATPWQ
jgi:hypothetical protein